MMIVVGALPGLVLGAALAAVASRLRRIGALQASCLLSAIVVAAAAYAAYAFNWEDWGLMALAFFFWGCSAFAGCFLAIWIVYFIRQAR